MRMLTAETIRCALQLGSNNIRAHVGDFIFTSKLVDGRFPDYRRVLPEEPGPTGGSWLRIPSSRRLLARRFSLTRNSAGVRLYVSENQLKITANNPEQEEAEGSSFNVTYSGAEMEIGLQRELCAGCYERAENAKTSDDADRFGFQRAD
ncbi:hypothetical protein ACNKHL_22545 [Shigella flexneri]